MAEAIDWSAPVVVETGEDGALRVELPAKLVAALALSGGDVVSFTGFRNGAVEVWSIKKSPYSSLDDAGAAARMSRDDGA